MKKVYCKYLFKYYFDKNNNNVNFDFKVLKFFKMYEKFVDKVFKKIVWGLFVVYWIWEVVGIKGLKEFEFNFMKKDLIVLLFFLD